MRIECYDDNFFQLDSCWTLWNLFKTQYIFPFIYQKMQDFNEKIKESYYILEVAQNNIPPNIHDEATYRKLLQAYKNLKHSDNINSKLPTEINIYMDFLATFIMDIIYADSIQQHLQLDKQLYRHIESLYTQQLYIELLYVDNDAMQTLNYEYMHKNYPTDVLSFPLTTQAIEIEQCLGSIIFNIYEICDKAVLYKHNIYAEISLLFIHAFLHILGFDHENDNGIQRRIEQYVIEQLHLPKSLIMRTHDDIH